MSEVTNKTKRQYRRKASADTLEARVEAVELVDAVQPEMAAAPSAPPAPPMLTQEELFKIKLYQVEAQRAAAEAETARMRKKWILALIDPKGTVAAEEERVEKWKNEARTFYSRYELVKERASKRLGIDLKDCGFDPETGLVVPNSAKGK
jgi:hypothetical protein